jgi:hypothetical protein
MVAVQTSGVVLPKRSFMEATANGWTGGFRTFDLSQTGQSAAAEPGTPFAAQGHCGDAIERRRLAGRASPVNHKSRPGFRSRRDLALQAFSVPSGADFAVKIECFAQRLLGRRRIAKRGGEAAAEFQDARRQ